MTAEPDLLPLPEWAACDETVADMSTTDVREAMNDYARACVSSATEALRAEVGRLQTKAAGAVDAARGYQRELAREYARAELLAEALRIAMQALIPLHNAHMPDERAGLTDEDVAAAEAAFEQARAALDQEAGRG